MAFKMVNSFFNIKDYSCLSKSAFEDESFDIKEKLPKDKRTVLMQAVFKNCNVELVEKIISKTQNINEVDNDGWSALMYAARHCKNVQIIDMLVKNGADVNLQTKQGTTALMMAVKYNSGDVVKSLCNYGANRYITDKKGKSANDYYAIKQIIKTRNILCLMHFTRIENLFNILKYGLLSKDILESKSINFRYTDDNRLDDGARNSICCSISYPNSSLFYRKRNENRFYIGNLMSFKIENVLGTTFKKITNIASDFLPNECARDEDKWVVLCLSPDVLWKKKDTHPPSGWFLTKRA